MTYKKRLVLSPTPQQVHPDSSVRFAVDGNETDRVNKEAIILIENSQWKVLNSYYSREQDKTHVVAMRIEMIQLDPIVILGHCVSS
jgi:hypothetical protein